LKKNININKLANIKAQQLIWDRTLQYEEIHRSYDYIIGADCLFLEKYHTDLVHTLYQILSENGEAIFISPRRGLTLEKFCNSASQYFKVEVIIDFDKSISDQGEKFKLDPLYSEDVHRPILVKVKR